MTKGSKVWAATILAGLAGAGAGALSGNYLSGAKALVGVVADIRDRQEIIEKAEAKRESALRQILKSTSESDDSLKGEVQDLRRWAALELAGVRGRTAAIEEQLVKLDAKAPQSPTTTMPIVQKFTVYKPQPFEEFWGDPRFVMYREETASIIFALLDEIEKRRLHRHPAPAPRMSQNSKGIR